MAFLGQTVAEHDNTHESLYLALSPKGNPRLSTLLAVTKAVGLKLTVEAA